MTTSCTRTQRVLNDVHLKNRGTTHDTRIGWGRKCGRGALRISKLSTAQIHAEPYQKRHMKERSASIFSGLSMTVSFELANCWRFALLRSSVWLQQLSYHDSLTSSTQCTVEMISRTVKWRVVVSIMPPWWWAYTIAIDSLAFIPEYLMISCGWPPHTLWQFAT